MIWTPRLFQAKPGVVIGREFFFEGDDAIASFPIDAEGDGGDAFGGVLDDGDFFRRRIDEAGGGLAQAGVGIHPFVVVQGAEWQSIFGQPANGVGGAAAEGGHGGVIQVDQFLGDWEFFAVAGGDALTSVIKESSTLSKPILQRIRYWLAGLL